jgi:hypothetical protein
VKRIQVRTIISTVAVFEEVLIVLRACYAAKMSYVLLYYKYTDLSTQQQTIAKWFETSCGALTGRVRVAKDGINVTVRETAAVGSTGN